MTNEVVLKNSKDPDISIILPVYNVENYLKSCIDSIISQNTLSFEIIAINDASTDNSLRVLNEYVDKCNIVIIDLDSNKGAGHARNIALPKVTGRYTLFIDSDDYCLQGTLDKLVKLADKNQTDIVFFTYQIWHEKNDLISPMFPTDRSKWDKILNNKNQLLVTIDSEPSLLTVNNYPWNKLFSTKFLKNNDISYSETIVNNDIYAHWVSLIKSKKILMLDMPCYVHRLFDSREQITTYFDERRFDLFKAINHVDDFFTKNNQYKKMYYHQFLLFKLDLLRWAKSKIPENLLSRFKQETSHSMRYFSYWDFVSGVIKDPRMYFSLLLIKLKIFSNF